MFSLGFRVWLAGRAPNPEDHEPPACPREADGGRAPNPEDYEPPAQEKLTEIVDRVQELRNKLALPDGALDAHAVAASVSGLGFGFRARVSGLGSCWIACCG